MRGGGSPPNATLWRVKLLLNKPVYKHFPKSQDSLQQVKTARDTFCAEEIIKLRDQRINEGLLHPDLTYLASSSRYRNRRVGMAKHVGSARQKAKAWRRGRASSGTVCRAWASGFP